MGYPVERVFEIQLAVEKRLLELARERNMHLDGRPTWFGGSMDPPKPGQDWTLEPSMHGRTATVVLTPADRLDFMGTWPTDVVTRKLGQALDAIRPERAPAAPQRFLLRSTPPPPTIR